MKHSETINRKLDFEGSKAENSWYGMKYTQAHVPPLNPWVLQPLYWYQLETIYIYIYSK